MWSRFAPYRAPPSTVCRRAPQGLVEYFMSDNVITFEVIGEAPDPNVPCRTCVDLVESTGQRRDRADAPGTRDAARRGLRDVATMTQEQHRWLTTLGVASVGELNNAAVHGRVAELIRVSEGFQEKRIGRIADSDRHRFI